MNQISVHSATVDNYLNINKTLKRIYHQDKPVYVITAIFGFVSILYSIMPFEELATSDFILFTFQFIFFITTAKSYMAPYLKVVEQGKFISVYQKYKYSPISLKLLYHSQLRLLSRPLLVLGLSGQLVQLFFTVGLAHYRISYYTFVPLYSALFTFLLIACEILWQRYRSRR